MAGRSSHPINPKRVNVLVEPVDDEQGTFTVKTYTYLRRNSRRVPLVLRNDSSREVVLSKGLIVAVLSPANLEKPVSREWEQRVSDSLLENESNIHLKGAILEKTNPFSPDEKRIEKLFSKNRP